MSDAADHDRAESRRAYEKVLGIVEHNTGDPQPPLMRWSTVLTIGNHGNITAEQAQRVAQAAVENGDLIKWADGAGYRRVGLADPAAGHFGPEDVGAIRSVLETECSAPSPNSDVVAWCNARLAELDPGAGPDLDAGDGGGQ